MGFFTKKRLKGFKEIIKGIKKGDLSLTKRGFSVKETVKTVKVATKAGKKIKVKTDELKEIQNELFNKNIEE